METAITNFTMRAVFSVLNQKNKNILHFINSDIQEINLVLAS